MSTPQLCVSYDLSVIMIRVWFHRKRTNKSDVVIPVLILNPLHQFYSLSTFELKSGSLFQFAHYFFVCASALHVSKYVIFVLYICSSGWPSCECSWRAPIFIGDRVISSPSWNLMLPNVCRFLIYCAWCNPDSKFNLSRKNL